MNCLRNINSAVSDRFNIFKFVLASSCYALGRQPLIVKLFGLKYKRSRKGIEIDLTYDCQLKCFNCNRSCSQAPTAERMTIEQVKKFVKESIDNNVQWERIRLVGGEPTLHRGLFEIINLLIDYKRNHSPNTAIYLITNGFGPQVNKVLEKVPSVIVIENSHKKTSAQVFSPFNIAPQDSPNYKPGDYEAGCVNSSVCGIALTPYGYYCCGIAGGIDRILGLDIGRKSLPKYEDDMTDHFRVFCKLCGIFASFKFIQKEVMSITWEKIYEKYKKEKSELTLY